MVLALWAPPLDVLRDNDYWYVKVELAGVCPDQVTISVNGDELTLRGTRIDNLLSRGYTYHSLEISYCRFERRVKLPFVIDTQTIDWQFQDGMLLIQVGPWRERQGHE